MYDDMTHSGSRCTNDNGYLNELKSVAQYQGYSAETIDELLKSGFSLEEIEEYIYEV